MTQVPLALEGQLSIRAAIEAGSRPIHRILFDRDRRGQRQVARLLGLARKCGILIEQVSAPEIAEVATGKTHGGIIALVGERRFAQLDDLLPECGPAFVVMLDGIEDPYNFGFALRALYAAGVDGVVLRRRNWSSATSVVGRASAGSSERISMAIAEGAEGAAAHFRARGLLVAAAARSRSSASLYQSDLTRPLFLLIGGERRGVTRSFQAQADLLLEIPYGRRAGSSLGTVSAASIIAFEVMRQRQSRA